MSRPRKRPADKAGKSITVRFRPSEYAAIEAARDGVPVARFVADCAIGVAAVLLAGSK